ncbi:MAG: hypothetical protein J3Q66DRAFT_353536, partial [Benniella sp.]
MLWEGQTLFCHSFTTPCLATFFFSTKYHIHPPCMPTPGKNPYYGPFAAIATTCSRCNRRQQITGHQHSLWDTRYCAINPILQTMARRNGRSLYHKEIGRKPSPL